MRGLGGQEHWQFGCAHPLGETRTTTTTASAASSAHATDGASSNEALSNTGALERAGAASTAPVDLPLRTRVRFEMAPGVPVPMGIGVLPGNLESRALLAFSAGETGRHVRELQRQRPPRRRRLKPGEGGEQGETESRGEIELVAGAEGDGGSLAASSGAELGRNLRASLTCPGKAEERGGNYHTEVYSGRGGRESEAEPDAGAEQNAGRADIELGVGEEDTIMVPDATDGEAQATAAALATGGAGSATAAVAAKAAAAAAADAARGAEENAATARDEAMEEWRKATMYWAHPSTPLPQEALAMQKAAQARMAKNPAHATRAAGGAHTGGSAGGGCVLAFRVLVSSLVDLVACIIVTVGWLI